MANITFLTDFEQGHLFPTFRLAKTLTKRGHKVRYLGIPDMSGFVRSQNFEMLEIFSDIYPLGTLAELAVKAGQLNQEELLDQHLPQLLQNSEVDEVLLNYNPDLIIANLFASLETLILWYKHRIPTVIFTTSLRLPQADFTAHVTQRIMNCGAEVYRLIELAAQINQNIKTFEDLASPLRNIPEIIPCPRDLELPGQDLGENIWYIEPSIRETDNNCKDFKWPTTVNSKKLIYVSLGSQIDWYLEQARTAYRKLLDMMRMTRDRNWHYILSLSKSFEMDEFGDIPPNVTVSRWLPQIDVLKQASLMITHGGLGAIKECIFFGVPMVVLPLGRDQFDNAQRITHHKLGTTLDLEATNGLELVSVVERILEDPSTTSGIVKMQKIFRQAEESEVGADLLEHFLASSMHNSLKV